MIVACEAGARTRREIAEQFQISERTLYERLRRWRACAPIAPAAHVDGRVTGLDAEVLRKLVAENTPAEYAAG